MVFPKQLLPLVGQLHLADAHFPPPSAGRNLDAHGAADDLVAEADADEADAGLGEDFLRESDEAVDPGGGVVGVEFWMYGGLY